MPCFQLYRNAFIRRALKRPDSGNIPVISINLSGLEGNPGFKITPSPGPAWNLCGDLRRHLHEMRLPVAAFTRQCLVLPMLCTKSGRASARSSSSQGYPSRRRFKQLCREIIEDFDNNLELLDVKKPRVGVVGEILVKFLPAANNHLVDLLRARGRRPWCLIFWTPALLLLQPELKSVPPGHEEVQGDHGESWHQGARMVSGACHRSV